MRERRRGGDSLKFLMACPLFPNGFRSYRDEGDGRNGKPFQSSFYSISGGHLKKMRMDYKLGLPGGAFSWREGTDQCNVSVSPNHTRCMVLETENVMHDVLLRKAMVQIILSIGSERQK